MELEVKKLVYDLDQATERIAAFTQGKRLQDYKADALLRSGVERQFEIVGEALNRLKKVDPEIVAQITDYRRIIGFRNVLAHGYDVVSDDTTWDIVQNKLATLRQEIAALKKEAGIT